MTGVFAAVLVLAANASATTPTQWGKNFAHWYDQKAFEHKDPVRIIEIGCKDAKVQGYKLYLCDVTTRNKVSKSVVCGRILISPDYQVLRQKQVVCA